ncbi:hypothetical protein H9L41_23725 [Chitinimonas koreensis]|nr:hypothetical protein [Chitinimonas koreensis]QNM96719.1 hypothetical protein H9L41_23725 [Chitinimonas koreensis]
MKKTVPPPVPIPQPPEPPPGLAADVVASGQPVHPEDRIKLFSDRQWEVFIQEWVDSLRDDYDLVERCGGAGDMGRDVIAMVKGGSGVWDNYQCKHYGDSLKPSDIWVELGKLAYYTKRGDYERPRRYYFIAPKGVGTKLSNLLRKPEELKSELLKQWDAHCREGITTTEKVECDAAMKAHIESLDFSIFQATPVLRIIEGHAKTRWHAARFGEDFPSALTRWLRQACPPTTRPYSSENFGARTRSISNRTSRILMRGSRLTRVSASTSMMPVSSFTALKGCEPSRATRCRQASSRNYKMRFTPASRTMCAASTTMATAASSRW